MPDGGFFFGGRSSWSCVSLIPLSLSPPQNSKKGRALPPVPFAYSRLGLLPDVHFDDEATIVDQHVLIVDIDPVIAARIVEMAQAPVHIGIVPPAERHT